jgi:hypothetical protein
MEGAAVTDTNRQPDRDAPEELIRTVEEAALPESCAATEETVSHRQPFESPEDLSVSPITGADKVKGTVRRFFVWLLLSAKRFLKKPSFVLIFLMLPAVLLLYRALITADDGKLHVAVYFEEKDEFAKTYLRELSENVPELFVFYECEEEEDLYSDVAAGRAECGYSFSAGIAQKLPTEEWQGLITAVLSDQTMYGEFVNEIAYIKLIRILGKDLMLEYLVNKSGVVKEGDSDKIRELLEKKFGDEMASNILVEYVTTAQKNGELVIEEKKHDAISVLKKPIRGTIAIFVLLTGLAGLVFWYQDDAEGRFRVMARERRPLISFASILLPTAMAGIVGLVCLAISGLWTTTGRELFSMLLYVLLAAGLCNILRFLIPSVHAVCAMIPILVLISYLCCPILIDIGQTMPVIRYVRALLAPQYYLRIYEGRTAGALAVATGVLLAVSALLSIPERNR